MPLQRESSSDLEFLLAFDWRTLKQRERRAPLKSRFFRCVTTPSRSL
jgi:hypothetical protein